jgi:deoxyribonuclease-1-like protein
MKKFLALFATLFAAFAFVLLLGACDLLGGLAGLDAEVSGGPLRFYSFNMLRFDDAKAKNTKISRYMAGLLQDASLAALQEVQLSDERLAREFCAKAGAAGGGTSFGYTLSPSLGSSIYYKEKFLFIYRNDVLTLQNSAVYPDTGKKFERPPFAALFSTRDGRRFIVLNIHIKPDEAGTVSTAEIAALPAAASHFKGLWKTDDCLLMGDFNADGAYYDEKKLARVFPLASWKIIVPNSADTTVSGANDNTYDRIIASKSAASFWTEQWGTVRFDETSACRAITKSPMQDISDHYPVWAEFF